MITYELAKQLKDAGFPQNHEYGMTLFDNETKITLTVSNSDDYDSTGKPPFIKNVSTGLQDRYIKIPTLSELIEACKESTPFTFVFKEMYWVLGVSKIDENSRTSQVIYEGNTPEEAVANLWLELNKK